MEHSHGDSPHSGGREATSSAAPARLDEASKPRPRFIRSSPCGAGHGSQRMSTSAALVAADGGSPGERTQPWRRSVARKRPTQVTLPRPVGRSEGLKREFSVWAIFALAFAFISPIVALYGIFTFSYTSAGPAAWFGFLVVLAGQLLVALVFAELASRWPFEGSLYQWSRRLHSRDLRLVHRLGLHVDADDHDGGRGLRRRRVRPGGARKRSVRARHPARGGPVLRGLRHGHEHRSGARCSRSFMARASPPRSSVPSASAPCCCSSTTSSRSRRSSKATARESGSGGYIWAGFFAAVAFIGWTYVGFETAASVAEEVRDPRREVPKAIILSLVLVAAVVTYAALALILAIPDPEAVIAGEVVDPVADTISFQLGDGITKTAVRAVHRRLHGEPARHPDQLLASHVGLRAGRCAAGRPPARAAVRGEQAAVEHDPR